MAPFFLMNFSDRFFPVSALERFQYPGLAIAKWVWRAVAACKYVAEHRMGHDLAVAASAMAMLIQAAIFAVAALGVIHRAIQNLQALAIGGVRASVERSVDRWSVDVPLLLAERR